MRLARVFFTCAVWRQVVGKSSPENTENCGVVESAEEVLLLQGSTVKKSGSIQNKEVSLDGHNGIGAKLQCNRQCRKCRRSCGMGKGSKRCKRSCGMGGGSGGGGGNGGGGNGGGGAICRQSCTDSGNTGCNNECQCVGLCPSGDADCTRNCCVNSEGQFTPCQSDWRRLNLAPLLHDEVSGHDPASIGWIGSSEWEEARWDGTTYRPNEMSRDDFLEAICPQQYIVRGLREVFEELAPFSDNAKPTKAEVDEWHLRFLRHVRELVGYADRTTTKDHCTFAGAQWGNERKQTDMWNAADPVGTCDGNSGAHCGFGWMPTAAEPNQGEQAEYLPSNAQQCTWGGGSEGIFGVRAEDPWSIRVARAFCGTLRSEGFWGGHMGPFWRREKFGWNFWDRGTGVTMRALYSGQLFDQYAQPR